MTDLEFFRERIRNWARAQCSSRGGSTSGFYSILRNAAIYGHGDAEDIGWLASGSSGRTSIDIKDAELLGKAYARLPRKSRDVIKANYISKLHATPLCHIAGCLREDLVKKLAVFDDEFRKEVMKLEEMEDFAQKRKYEYNN